ncbi:MAG: CPBP family glutamic-type intramembrane protease [Oscillospiraceae bacterium]
MSEILKPEKKKRKFSLFDNLVGILIVGYFLIVGGQTLGDYVIEPGLAAVLAAMIPGLTDGAAWVTATLYVGFLGIWAVTLLVMFLTSRNRPMLKALTTETKGNTLKMFAVGLGIGLGMNLLCALIAILHGDIALTFHSFRPVSFLLLFIAVLIQSAAEELICRVFIYQRLVRRYGKPVLAALANAAFFAAIHLGNPGVTNLAILNIFFYGILFSAMVVYMDSPWAAMAAHAAWNFCQNIILGLPNSGMVMPYSVFKLDAASATDSFAYSVSFGLESTITASITLFAVAALITWWGTKRKVIPTDIWNSAEEN